MAKPTGGRTSGGKRGNPAYVPDVGDLVWFSFSPHAGREQAGRRPAVILSPRTYNSKTSLCLLCPVTGQAKGYPFEVALPEGLPIQGVILSDHLRCGDWRERRAEHIGCVPAEVLDQVRAKLCPLLGI